jgi:citrate lyase gamma subunit
MMDCTADVKSGNEVIQSTESFSIAAVQEESAERMKRITMENLGGKIEHDTKQSISQQLFNVARLSVEEKGAFEQMMKERIQISK